MHIKKVLFVALMMFLSCHAATQVNDWQRMALNGQVKSMVVKETLTALIDHDSTIMGEVIYEYFFNEAGYKMQRKHFEYGELIDNRFYQYENGKLKRIASYKQDTILSAIHLFITDSMGNRLVEEITLADNSPNARYLYKYDNKGNKIEMLGYNLRTDTRLFVTETFKYDTDGNLIETKTDDQLTAYVYEFDKQGRIIQKTSKTSIDEKETYHSKLNFYYDSKGNCIREVVSEGIQKRTSNYSWDKTGNWISKFTKTVEDRLVTVKREIVYH